MLTLVGIMAGIFKLWSDGGAKASFKVLSQHYYERTLLHNVLHDTTECICYIKCIRKCMIMGGELEKICEVAVIADFKVPFWYFLEWTPHKIQIQQPPKMMQECHCCYYNMMLREGLGCAITRAVSTSSSLQRPGFNSRTVHMGLW
jgi:hypothetical protein